MREKETGTKAQWVNKDERITQNGKKYEVSDYEEGERSSVGNQNQKGVKEKNRKRKEKLLSMTYPNLD